MKKQQQDKSKSIKNQSRFSKNSKASKQERDEKTGEKKRSLM